MYGENTAAFKSIFGRNTAVQFGKDVSANGQSEAGTTALRLGGIEGLEQVVNRIRIESVSGVKKFDLPFTRCLAEGDG